MQPPKLRTRAKGVQLALLACFSLACETQSPLRIRPGPIVPSQSFGPVADSLRKVAVVPFYPTAPSTAPGSSTEGTGWADAALLSRFVSEALSAQGVPVVAPNDVEIAFTAQGLAVPRLDPHATAERCARDFGASAVLLGRVLRYREREGSAAGSTRPTSVAFELTLYEAPGGRRLWAGHFDETQRSITEAILRARQYPGGGTRWLTAEEFSRWGASEAVKALLASGT